MENLFGRRIIRTDESVISRDNVLRVLQKAMVKHEINRREIGYLYRYYKGKTPILEKVKEVRETINNKVIENRANEIVNFKLGYTFGEPIQYIRRGDKAGLTNAIDDLNNYFFFQDKASSDKELAEWMYICGTGYRMVLPSQEDMEEPFEFFVLDPINSFVVYHNGLGNKPVMGVKYIIQEDGTKVYSVYTKDKYFEIMNDQIILEKPHVLNEIPIIEYPANRARLGAFEIVISLLDAINEVQSNRLDDLEQYVNSFLALVGGSIDEETYKKLETFKMLCLPEGVDAKYLSASLQQGDVQTLADSLYQNVLTICGIPNRNGGSSTSDTGAAVQLRDGWESAEAQAKSTELMFKKSEKRFLKVVLRILQDTVGTSLTMNNIEIKFARRYTDNILTKTQALTQLLDAGIAPEIAIATSGIWNDPTDVYLQSKPYLEKWEVSEEDGEDVRDNGSEDETINHQDPQDVQSL